MLREYYVYNNDCNELLFKIGVCHPYNFNVPDKDDELMANIVVVD
jgi:hypothetical protein